MEDVPRVGVGVFVVRDGKILFGKRKGSHGSGSWQLPGGHLEFKESWEDCAIREVMEETGLTVSNVKFLTATNDIFEKEGKHYITLFVLADVESGEPDLKEPDKCEGWDWFSWDDLPEPLFLSTQNLVEKGFNPLSV